MFRRFVAGLAVAALFGIPAQAADVPYTILLDGRPLTPRAAGTGAIARAGVVFIDVVVATKTFSGLLTFANAGNTVRLSIQHRTAVFRVGSPRAYFDGKARILPGAPFKSGGDIYVPLSSVASLGGAGLRLDTAHQVARLRVRPFASMLQSTPPPPAAAASAAAISLAPAVSVDAQGALHARLDVTNSSSVPVTLEFPNGGRAAFVVSRDGVSVWDSTRGMVFTMMVGFVTLAPKGTISFDSVWPGFATQPAGNYQLTARLMTRSPLVSSPVAVPAAPHPAAS